MPFYEYQCKSCGHELEAMQKISEAPLKKCPECGKSQLQRLISAPVFRLKGSGWYETDFKGDADNKRNLADRPDKDASSDSKDTDSKDSKETKESEAKPKEGAGDAKVADSKTDAAGAKTAGDKADKKTDVKTDSKAVKPVASKSASKSPPPRPARKSKAKMPKSKARR